LAKAKHDCPYVTPEALAKMVEDKTGTKVVLGTHDYK
jgi:predicted metal-binding protein